MTPWHCQRCDRTGEVSDDVAVVFHKCTPKRIARSLSIDDLTADDADAEIEARRLARWKWLLEGVS